MSIKSVAESVNVSRAATSGPTVLSSLLARGLTLASRQCRAAAAIVPATNGGWPTFKSCNQKCTGTLLEIIICTGPNKPDVLNE